MAATLADARVGQIHISVTDIDRSVAFYRDTLGLPFLFQVPGQSMAFFDCGGTRLYLAVPEPGFHSQPILYLAVRSSSTETTPTTCGSRSSPTRTAAGSR